MRARGERTSRVPVRFSRYYVGRGLFLERSARLASLTRTRLRKMEEGYPAIRVRRSPTRVRPDTFASPISSADRREKRNRNDRANRNRYTFPVVRSFPNLRELSKGRRLRGDAINESIRLFRIFADPIAFSRAEVKRAREKRARALGSTFSTLHRRRDAISARRQRRVSIFRRYFTRPVIRSSRADSLSPSVPSLIATFVNPARFTSDAAA